jgi:hypothetical protein
MSNELNNSDDTIPSRMADTVFGLLKQMENEADTIIGNDLRAGFVHYAKHIGTNTRLYERFWTHRLAELLTQGGHSARNEVTYPGSSKRCDVVVNFEGVGQVWLEVKSAWKSWIESSGEFKTNPKTLYWSYLLGSSGGMKKSHSAAHDFEKLDQLKPSDADYAAFLLIGFYAKTSPMGPDVDALVRQADLLSGGWKSFGPETWTDCNDDRCRISCWFWCRKVT